MAKGKNSVFFCQSCGYESTKWMGQCPACKEWNTMVEEVVDKKTTVTHKQITELQVSKLNDVQSSSEERLDTHIKELNRVLGGGIVPGSLVLVGGDPGIGKSTLLLQTCRSLSDQHTSVLYISGEESLQQIKMRADRIGTFSDDMMLLCETNLDLIQGVIEERRPQVVVVDSIQTMFRENVNSAPGSVSQVREATSVLMRLAKERGIAIFVVGHVTKEGTVAGPRVLEHMVDTVLYFEGDRYAAYRILRAVKNRFGSTNEIGVFEMCQTGLREVPNPSEYMLDGKPQNASGSIVVCTMEGTRPLLVEIQALVCHSAFGMPRRTAAGVDYNRVNLLMAVLEKTVGVKLADQDAYINIAGGMKISEPAVDLGLVLSIISSFRNRPIAEDVICFGEVGLSGEVRSVNMVEQRIAEARKLGFKQCILPKVCMKNIQQVDGMQLKGVENVREALEIL
ncbi:MAG: DNA repair protein RadA [Lachnospiraceae bacterium]|nr:DNA repair protein RadA [Lachnospiraceae bacterium]